MKRLQALKDRNFKLLLADALFWGLGFAMASPTIILPAFSVLLVRRIPALEGYENIVGTLLFSIFSFGMAIPPLFGSHWIRGERRVLPVVLRMVLFQRVSWVVLALGLWLWRDHPLRVLGLLFLTLTWNSFFSGAVLPPWLELYARCVSPSERGKVTGLRNSLVGVGGIACLSLTPWLLHSLPFPYNYCVLFTASSIAFSFSTLVILRIREAFPPRPHARAGFLPHLRELAKIPGRDPGFRAYLRQQFLSSFRSFGNPTLATLILATSFGLSDARVASWSGGFALLLSLSSLATGPFWGRLSDRFGHRRIQGLALMGSGLACLTAALARSPEFLAVFFVLFGIANSGMMVSVENMTLDMAPASERASYVSLRLLANSPALLVPVLGGWMADRAGHALPLLLACLVSFASVFHLWTRVPDPRRSARGAGTRALLES